MRPLRGRAFTIRVLCCLDFLKIKNGKPYSAFLGQLFFAYIFIAAQAGFTA
jgi:hypothetical protein